ncbi:terminase small subunit [Luteimonas marina]|uniref:Terminase small subunit n=1 Tax=Luteimonas marina TaxID=488485 RepID=A0A5C5TYX2_9GAMM|nr:terminase small subunit [Luteimonas marina]TWT18525.1 terminase small subunit [Luteimonas marina]
MAKRDKATGLTDQQMRFAQEYLTDFNASAAYRRAGYKGTAAAIANNACRLLATKRMQEYLQGYRQQVMETTTLSVERLAKELERICFSDPRALFEANGALKNLSMLDEDTARTVAGVELGDKVKITLWDKLGAIEKALKLLNAYPDRKQDAPAQTIVGVVIVPAKGSIAPPQQRAALEGQAPRMQRVATTPARAKPFRIPATGR